MALTEAVRPTPRLWLDEWAYQYRELTKETSAFPGRFEVSRIPPMREVYRAASDLDVHTQTVVGCFAGQVSKTELLLNAIGQAVHNGGSTMVVLPIKESLQTFASQRLPSLIEKQYVNGVLNPVWQKLIGANVGKRKQGTWLQRRFPGGFLLLASGGSAPSLNGPPMRRVIGDEIDRLRAKLGADGPPIPQMRRRTGAMPHRKHLWLSTPTVRGRSAIQREFAATDMCFCYLPCPFCYHRQVLRFAPSENYAGGLVWDSETSEVFYQCERCLKRIGEEYKDAMLRDYEWQPGGYDDWSNVIDKQRIARDPNARGFHLSALYSPFYTWAEIRRDWQKARSSPEEMQGFVNLVLANLWDGNAPAITLDSEVPKHKLICECGAGRAVECPPDTALITVGVDLQGDRIECTAVAWNETESGVVIEHTVLAGRTTLPPSVPGSVWQKLTEQLSREYVGAPRNLRVEFACVDSGYAKVLDNLHTWHQSLPPKLRKRVFLIRGAAIPDKPTDTIWPKTAKMPDKHGRSPTYTVRVDLGKTQVFAMLANDIGDSDAQRICFADIPQLDSAYFAGVYSEDYTRTEKGYEWVQRVRRNEPLDCLVYSLAALRGWQSAGGRLRQRTARVAPRAPGRHTDEGDDWVR